jgi:hypothetical protein
MAWDEVKRLAAIEAYQDGNPTPENSMELVKEIAEDLEESPNGVRMILTKNNVYVKKSPAAAASSSSGSSGGTRISKQAACDALIAALTDTGQEVDEDIISKLTGKAAQYFTGVINSVNNN